MYIIASTIPLSQRVNGIGKYLKNHLDGAFKMTKDRNTCDVYVTLLYVLKEEYGGDENDVQEMTINISITTYRDKIRVNTIEVSPMERTLGFDLIKGEEFDDLKQGLEIVKWKVGNRIRKAYEKYLILF